MRRSLLLSLDRRSTTRSWRRGNAPISLDEIPSPTLQEIVSNAPKVLLGFVNQILRLGALFQSFHHPYHMVFIAKVRAGARMAKMCKATETAVFDAGEFQAAGTHWVIALACETWKRVGGAVHGG